MMRRRHHATLTAVAILACGAACGPRPVPSVPEATTAAGPYSLTSSELPLLQHNEARSLDHAGPADHFGKVRVITNVAEPRAGTESILTLDADRLFVRARSEGGDLTVLPYRRIRSAQYSFTTGRRWKASALVAVLWSLPQLPPGPFAALPVFLMKGKRHWLSVTAESDVVVLRLDKTNYQAIVSAFEARSGITVETVGERSVHELGDHAEPSGVSDRPQPAHE